MTSRLAYRRLRTSLIGAAVAAAIAPSAASAATTVGSSDFTPAPAGLCQSGTLYLQTASPGSSYAAPTAGVLTSWSFRAGSTPPQVKLLVVRATGVLNEYRIVGASEPRTSTANTLLTDAGVSIAVQPGDILGVRISATGQCVSDSGQTGFVVQGLTSPNPEVGDKVVVGSGEDRQVNVSATLEPDTDGDGLGDETEDEFVDADEDGADDSTDNCTGLANPDQADLDGDEQGDACDGDDDGDGADGVDDNCATVANAGQENADGDAQGDACDSDDDGDGVADATDNCPALANANQANADGDALGDACDPTPRPVTPPPPPPVDTTAPVLSALSLASARFTAKAGTEVTLSVDEASTVRLKVQRKAKGRKVGARCNAQTRANRGRKACTRWVAVKGSFSIDAAAGETSFTFRGRIGTKKLKPGRYRLSAKATDAAGNASGVARARFRITR